MLDRSVSTEEEPMQTVKIDPSNIKGFECKLATYIEAQDDSMDDCVIVKEIVHLDDGTAVPNVRFWENYKRDVYMTKPGLRTHEHKKDFEALANLQRYECTQRMLATTIARVMKSPYYKDIRMMCRSQYVYGADVGVAEIIKNKYQERYSDLYSLNRVAVLDLEADVVYGTEQILSGSLTFKDRVVLVVNRFFIQGLVNVEEELQKYFVDLLGEYQKSRNINFLVRIVDYDYEVPMVLMQYAHEWSPDIIAIWNIAYDMPKMLNALKSANIDPATVFSDPKCPPKFMYYNWVEGPTVKVTSSGRTFPLAPAERWHTFTCAAGFKFLDAMCVYQKIRIAGGKVPGGYSLDNILHRHLGIRKLKFKQADHLEGLKWHEFMQSNYKLEYLIYNVFDCISVELLDELNMDLCNKINLFSGVSNFDKFSSQPRRTCDALHFFALQEEHAIGSTSDKMKVDELDDLVVGVDQWIVTLPSHMVAYNGLKCIKEFPDITTLVWLHVADELIVYSHVSYDKFDT